MYLHGNTYSMIPIAPFSTSDLHGFPDVTKHRELTHIRGSLCAGTYNLLVTNASRQSERKLSDKLGK